MMHVILVVLLLGVSNLVSCETVDLKNNSTSALNSTSTSSKTVDLISDDINSFNVSEKVESIDVTSSNVPEVVDSKPSDELGKSTLQEIRDIIAKTLDKKNHDKKSESLVNSPEEQVNLSSTNGFYEPEEHFHYYARPIGYVFPIEHTPLNAYDYRQIENKRGTFSIFDRLTPENSNGLPVRQVLEGPINIAVPLINQEIALYFVNRGLISLKSSPSLQPVYDALHRRVRKMGLTLPAAYSLRSRYLSWPVKSVVFAEPVFLTDIINTATYPTILFAPEDDFELLRTPSDIFRIADFALLEDGIRYNVLPSPKQVI